MNRIFKTFVLFVLLLMVIIVNVPSSLAYFSTFTQAKGTKRISLKDESKITEPLVSLSIKEIKIEANPDSEPVFVRIAVFHVDDIKTSKSDTAVSGKYEPGKWTSVTEDGITYYVYADPISGNSFNMNHDVTFMLSIDQLPSGVKDGDEANIIVVYEAVVASTDSSGNWVADWSKEEKITKTTIETGGDH